MKWTEEAIDSLFESLPTEKRLALMVEDLERRVTEVEQRLHMLKVQMEQDSLSVNLKVSER